MVRYGYNCDFDMDDVEMAYMDEYEYTELERGEVERRPMLTHIEFVKGIEAINIAERKALILDLVENWETIYYGKMAGHEVLEKIVERMRSLK